MGHDSKLETAATGDLRPTTVRAPPSLFSEGVRPLRSGIVSGSVVISGTAHAN